MGHEHRNKSSGSLLKRPDPKKAVSRENIVQKLELLANGRAHHFHHVHMELEPLGADHCWFFLLSSLSVRPPLPLKKPFPVGSFR